VTAEYHSSPPQRTTKHRAALRYSRKVPVFPCKRDKTPYTPHGHLDATTDQSRINAYWNRQPDANPAMPTGQRSGVFVLDVDLEAWGAGSLDALEEQYGKLPDTYTVKTGGGGLHYYFRFPSGVEIRNSAGKLGLGLDTRGEGGYVLLPGSFTEGAYEVLERHEIADAPAWLVKLVRKPKPRNRGSRQREGSTVGLDNGGPILEGTRNQTLFFIALDLKDSGKDREEALGGLVAINEARCVPPLEEREVEAIVKSAFRYPVRGKRTPPEVLESLKDLKRAWWATAWRGVGGKSDRDILRVLIQLAERYGYLIPAGVRVSISWRDLAIAAGCGLRTVARVVQRLKLSGWLRGDNAQRSGTDSGAFVLLPRQTGTTQSIARGRCERDAESDATLSTLPGITPCFRWRGFVGKGKAGVLYVLEVLGPQSLEEIAARLGWKSVRDLKSRYLRPLAELGLIEDRGGVYALPGEARYVERVRDIRKARYGGGPRKVRRKDMQGRWVSRVVEVPPMSEDEREEADRQDYENQRRKHRGGDVEPTPHVANIGADGYTGELEVVPNPDGELLAALRKYLRRYPHRHGEAPSWLSVALWSEDYLEGKPSPAAVELALADLDRGAAA
jgi:hypothetical protein